MANRRFIFIAAIIGALLIVIVMMSVLFTHHQTPTAADSSSSLINYTDVVTGQSIQDKPSESSQIIISGLLNPPGANIVGFDQLNSPFTADQISNLQVAIDNFLLARSGLSNVTAGIQQKSIQEPDNQTLKFTLVAVRPQATYQVTATVANQYQLIPNVTFKQVD